MKVYRHAIVESIENFYGALLFQIDAFSSIKNHLTAIAERMWEGIRSKNPAVYHEISNYHPGYLGRSADDLEKTKLTMAHCSATVAHEYGFGGWQELEKRLGNTPYDLQFETAVNNLLNGNIEALQQQMIDDPALVKKRSGYGHEATLLHYTAGNGVALWRQKVPFNLPEITTCLLEAGADIRATMKIYGGKYDTLALLTTSAHPFEAGIGHDMVRLLEKYLCN